MLRAMINYLCLWLHAYYATYCEIFGPYSRCKFCNFISLPPDSNGFGNNVGHAGCECRRTDNGYGRSEYKKNTKFFSENIYNDHAASRFAVKICNFP